MIHQLSDADANSMLYIINNGAEAYKGIIPEDRWKEPYMKATELRAEIESGVQFYGWVEGESLLGIMGIQPVNDVTLIRHAYVLSNWQRRGIGKKLLQHLLRLAQTPVILVGTWDSASWAIRFYQEFGFTLVSRKEGERLLRKYWNIPERQIETSVVLFFRKATVFPL